MFLWALRSLLFSHPSSVLWLLPLLHAGGAGDVETSLSPDGTEDGVGGRGSGCCVSGWSGRVSVPQSPIVITWELSTEAGLGRDLKCAFQREKAIIISRGMFKKNVSWKVHKWIERQGLVLLQMAG